MCMQRQIAEAYDEHVELAKLLLDLGLGVLDARVRADVDHEQGDLGLGARGSDLVYGRGALCRVACTDEDMVAGKFGQLKRGLKAEALVGAGDEDDLGRGHLCGAGFERRSGWKTGAAV
jgi:hypothetical protein